MTKALDQKLGSIHLQGIGRQKAIPAGSLKVGQSILYNYGSSHPITSIEPAGKMSVKVTVKDNTGKLWDRRYKKDRMVAIR